MLYKKLSPLSNNIILMSHLANANLPNDLSVEEQIKKFGDVTSNTRMKSLWRILVVC